MRKPLNNAWKVTGFFAALFVVSAILQLKQGPIHVTFRNTNHVVVKKSMPEEDKIHVAYVACGSKYRLDQVLNSIKSALYFSSNVRIKFHIITEQHLKNQFQKVLTEMKSLFKTPFFYELYQVEYPEDKQDWVKMFKQCATMRLFLPRLLADLKRVLYVDSDTIFIDSVRHHWRVFDDFNPATVAAYGPDTCLNYHRGTRHPFPGERGLNSGVFLMDLDRIREGTFRVREPQRQNGNKFNETTLQWEDALQLISDVYTFKLGDQGMLNILFGLNPERGLHFPCNLNYMLMFCKFSNCQSECCKPKPDGVECPEVAQYGVKLLHGANGVFRRKYQIPMGYAIYAEFDTFNLSEDINSFKQRLSERVNKTHATDGFCLQTYQKHMTNIAP